MGMSGSEQVPSLQMPRLAQTFEYWARPARYFDRCKSLGDRFKLHLFGQDPWLCLTHPDDVKRVFTASPDELHFGAALRRLAPHPLVLGPTSMSVVDGEEHLRQRRMQMPPFHGARLRSYEDGMREMTERALARWPYGENVSFQERMQELTLEIIMHTIFGIDDEDRRRRVHEKTLDLLKAIDGTRFLLQTVVAIAKGGDWNGSFPQIRRAVAALDEVILEEMTARRRDHDFEREDILSMFLQARDDDGRPMSEEEICDAMRTLLIAGHETTASSLAWTAERLVRHPGAMDRVEEEVASGAGTEYLEAAIAEAMRLRPVAPLTPRLVMKPFDLGDMVVDPGTMIMVHITLVHLRDDVYPNPLEFRPERFLDTPPDKYSWIPFGGGARRCLGASFAMMEMRVILETMLQHARFVSTGDTDEGIGRRNVTIAPRGRAMVTLERRLAA
jgi:cytochrome P450